MDLESGPLLIASAYPASSRQALTLPYFPKCTPAWNNEPTWCTRRHFVLAACPAQLYFISHSIDFNPHLYTSYYAPFVALAICGKSTRITKNAADQRLIGLTTGFTHFFIFYFFLLTPH